MSMTGELLREHAEWRTIDDPIVGLAGDDGRSCASCANWSQWLGETGDCLFHAYRRREAIIAAENPRELEAAQERWPSRSARMSTADEVCDGWTALSEIQQRRRAR